MKQAKSFILKLYGPKNKSQESHPFARRKDRKPIGLYRLCRRFLPANKDFIKLRIDL